VSPRPLAGLGLDLRLTTVAAVRVPGAALLVESLRWECRLQAGIESSGAAGSTPRKRGTPHGTPEGGTPDAVRTVNPPEGGTPNAA
jgi:hypothetical protein